MKISTNGWGGLAALLALCAPAFATVTVTARAVPKSPQPLGKTITWAVTGTDTNPGPLTFQIKIQAPGAAAFRLFKDYNVGKLSSGTWKPPAAFVWTPTAEEGKYMIQVNVKDFTSGETATTTVPFVVAPLAKGSTPVVVATANPLVALFSAPSCPTGSMMRVSFQPQSQATPATTTNWQTCHPPKTMTFEIVGMYQNMAYNMVSQTQTGGNIVNSDPVPFSTGTIPNSINFPPFHTIVGQGPNTDTVDSMVLHGVVQLGGGTHYPDVATDLSNTVMWYYISGTGTDLLTRPLQNGAGFLSLQSGSAWNPNTSMSQMLRQFDWAGNLVRETNTGILQQQLLKMGDTNAGACDKIAKPAPVGSACLGGFHHEAIQSLPNGYTAVMGDIERIWPAGTQPDASTLPQDIIGDIIIVLDADWQVKWYFDTFEHITGTGQLSINRPATLAETCTAGAPGCPPVLLLGTGIAPKAHDWLHANSIYYWPQTKDIIWSSRHQDWIMKIDYNNAIGTGDILWRMGVSGDFMFNNVNSDPWPWFSHQHEAAMENNGAGPLTIFDNGNTRISTPGTATGGMSGLGTNPKNCGPNDCNSRGVVLTVDETNMTVTPVLNQDLGYFSQAMGAAQMLENGNYFFLPAFVHEGTNATDSYAMEIYPTAGSVNGTPALNIKSTEAYRAWQIPSLYAPPIS